MWCIFDKLFLSDTVVVESAHESIRKAITQNNLTIVVGNGPTQSATLLDPRPDILRPSNTGWESAVIKAAEQAGVDEKFRKKGVNLLALAQAVLMEKGAEKGKELLMEEFEKELTRPIKATLVHEMLSELAPKIIVTTNYDLQIERVLEERGRNWLALVGNFKDMPLTNDNERTLVIKMHGTLKPDIPEKYKWANSKWETSTRDSIVIAESDYHECLRELQNDRKESKSISLLIEALKQPTLIIGKSLPWQDISFLYALSETREARNNAPAFFIAPSVSQEEELNLNIRGIIPLIINMPSTKNGEHYYVALAKALNYLCMEKGNRFEAEILMYAKNKKLLLSPKFVAIGLASHNITGRLEYAGSTSTSSPTFELPKPGRRSLKYEAYEHEGGSALTACSVFSSLDWNSQFPRSLISIVGSDIYKETVISSCKKNNIDIDAVEESASNTWNSTVLVFDVPEGGSIHRGQRIFLDRGYDTLLFKENTKEQLRIQLDQPELGLVYFDKFLAIPYPYDNSRREFNGPLMAHKDIFDKLSIERADVDILYETGTTGSQKRPDTGKPSVESFFSDNINILTSAFPFFVYNIMSSEYRNLLGQHIKDFTKKDYSNTEFSDEKLAILDLLSALQLNYEEKDIQSFLVPEAITKSGLEWVKRNHPKKWIAVTLHDFGAITIDLNSSKGVFVPVQIACEDEIQNTASAGDSFRGAFCYALLKTRELGYPQEASMIETTKFAVTIASCKCKYFKLIDAFDAICKQSQNYMWSKAI
jgi:sugar/nucleoside kinase (ribokinase family)